LNKSVQTGDFYTQTSVTYDTSGDAKLTTTPLKRLDAQTDETGQKLALSQTHRDSNENQQ